MSMSSSQIKDFAWEQKVTLLEIADDLNVSGSNVSNWLENEFPDTVEHEMMIMHSIFKICTDRSTKKLNEIQRSKHETAGSFISLNELRSMKMEDFCKMLVNSSEG